MQNDEYISTAEARSIIGVTTATLRKWDFENKIRTIRTPSNIRRYNKKDLYDIIGWNYDISTKTKIVYARVSSKKQMDDLERQTSFLRQQYPNHILVTDIASGINWKRKGLKTILQQSMQGNVEEVVVAHKDRLCRFAFELIEFVLSQFNTKLVVHDEDSHKSREEELADDLLSIVQIYACRHMGRRRYKNQTNTDIPEPRTTENFEEMDRNDESCL